jgi:antitoxin (DNA-binding transcriptional repressor) of toxin-antitoxin stability system
METISVSRLKAQLSAELKRVQSGIVLTVVDHKHPIANIVPLETEDVFTREAGASYVCRSLPPLMSIDPLVGLEEERRESW